MYKTYNEMLDYLAEEIDRDGEAETLEEAYEQAEELLADFGRYDTFFDEEGMEEYLMELSQSLLNVPGDLEEYVDRKSHIADLMGFYSSTTIRGEEWYII